MELIDDSIQNVADIVVKQVNKTVKVSTNPARSCSKA